MDSGIAQEKIISKPVLSCW